ncbi:MAG: cytochrome-c peroxidase [Candidatus Sericytochromatia bacterium]|nr:cytochrome-c peroxidase [Candidatus Sericytochromatia bacterium]
MAFKLHFTGLFAASLLLWACQPEKPAPDASTEPSANASSADHQMPEMSAADQKLWKQATAVFKPLPDAPASPVANPTTPEKVALGKMLFHDPRLSKSGAFSCNSCHNLASYGVDNRPTSIGHGFQTGTRNSPTVYNADYQLAQFWDGRAADLEAQAEGPILNPVEMAIPHEDLAVERIRSIPEYQQAFASAFAGEPEALTYKNIARAIATFERTLITPAPFDAFLKGDGQALNAAQKKGLQRFMANGCTACHTGIGVGGQMYQKFGLVQPYPHQKDTGRFETTGEATDKYFFKVPVLRNVTRTYPYFHDGKVWELEEAVRIMGKIQLGKDLPAEDVEAIVTFLESLTGKVPEAALTLPVLPPSKADTPRPEI